MVLVGGIVVLVVVVGLLVALLARRRSHDDEHSVQLYHRSLHTLEEMRAHPVGGEHNGDADATTPAAAFRVSGSSTVRLTEPGRTVVPPPLPPPPLANPRHPRHGEHPDDGRDAGDGGDSAVSPGAADAVAGNDAADTAATNGAAGTADEVGTAGTADEVGTTGTADEVGTTGTADEVGTEASAVLRFDDAGAGPGASAGADAPDHVPATFMSGSGDPAMHSINRRPRRLGAPAAAVGAVAVLIVVLVLTGMHSNKPSTHRGAGRTGTTATTTHTTATLEHNPGGGGHSGTTTTVPAIVSSPTAASAHTATYQVGAASYTLALAATNGACWVQATDTATGAVLFSGTLSPGQSHSLDASGPLSVVAGAPNVFSATVDGTAVALPPGFQAPFTLTLETPASQTPPT